ncbi:hypothetical protein OROMI_033473 [Orobanche minor]
MMVIDVQCVPSDFHARYKAQERTYFYRILSGKEPLSTFEKGRAWHVPEELDGLAMQKACQVLVGHHDFSSFRAAGCQAKSPIRTLEELTVTEVASSPYFPSLLEREQINYTTVDASSSSNKLETGCPSCIAGPSNMIIENFGGEATQGFGIRKRHRCFVITARARSFLYHQSISDVERILKARTVSAASPMAPAHGLYLGHVKYDLPPNIYDPTADASC